MLDDPTGDPKLNRFLGPRLPDSFPAPDEPAEDKPPRSHLAFWWAIWGAVLMGGCFGTMGFSYPIGPGATDFDNTLQGIIGICFCGLFGAAIGWLLGYLLDHI